MMNVGEQGNFVGVDWNIDSPVYITSEGSVRHHRLVSFAGDGLQPNFARGCQRRTLRVL